MPWRGTCLGVPGVNKETPVKTVPSRRTTYAGGKYVKLYCKVADIRVSCRLVFDFHTFYEYFRKITVHDTNPGMFRLFLEYLYSGVFDTSELSTEQLADMITLADRYEVILKFQFSVQCVSLCNGGEFRIFRRFVIQIHIIFQVKM